MLSKVNNNTGKIWDLKAFNCPENQIFLFLATILLIYWQTIHTLLLRWWSSPTYSHGLLVLPVALYLIWDKKEKLNEADIKPRYWVAIPLFLACVAWWLSNLANINIIQQILLIALIILSVVTAFGERAMMVIIFPIIYLITAIPVWNFIEPILQNMTVDIVSILLVWSDVSHFVEQHYITIPGGKFSVEEVCAGLRFVMAVVSITLLYAYFFLKDYKLRIMFVLAGILGSIVLNWVRVYIVVIAGYHTKMEHWLVHSHVGFGWWLFAFFLIPLFLFGKYLMVKENKKIHNENQDKIICEDKVKNKTGDTLSATPAIISLILLSIGPVSASIIKNNDNDAQTINLQMPHGKNGWQGPEESGDWQVFYPGSDAESLVVYSKGYQNVKMRSIYYQNQKQEKELIDYRNRLYDEKQWKLHRASYYQNNNKKYYEINLVSLNGNKRRLIWYWYNVGGNRITNAIEAKIMHVKDLLTQRKGSSIIAMSYDYVGSKDKAINVLEEFVNQMNPTTIIVEKEK